MRYLNPGSTLLMILMLIISACTTSPSGQSPDNSSRVILAIFAHPDDEATVSPVLAKYAREGATVYLAIATDGRLGVNNHSGIPAGDTLANVRKNEIICAAEKLGIKPPILFGLHDQLKMGEGNAAFNKQMDSLRRGVHKLFTELKPDVVLTWGASGWTGHHDHRLVGSVVTEVFESRKWEKPVQLYYPALPTGSLPADASLQLATVDSSYLLVKIPVTDNDLEQAKESWLCHKSQYLPETIDQMHQLLKSSLKGKVYFQPHGQSGEEKNSLF